MKEELVLSVYRGEGMQPKEGWTVVVTAHLEGKVVASDPVPLSSSPIFRQEMSWEVSSSIFDKYKNAKVPVRIECHSLDSSGYHHLIGSIILPLSSAVQGRKVDPKWHMLLGGPSSLQRMSPKLLLSLNVTPSSPSSKGDEPMQVSHTSDGIDGDKGTRELKVSSRHLSQPDVVLRKNSVNSTRSAREFNSLLVDSGRNNALRDGKLITDSLIKQNMTFPMGEVMISEKGSTSMVSNYDTRNAGRSSTNKLQPLRDAKLEVREYTIDDDDYDDPEKRLSANSYNLRSSRTQLVHKYNSEPLEYTSSRSIPQHSPSSRSKDGTRPLPGGSQSDISESLASGHNTPRRTNLQSAAQTSPNIIRENGHKPTTSATNDNDFVLAIASTSSGMVGKTETNNDKTQIIPRLNENGGFFQIGPVGEPDERMFHFSVTIVYAKNLDQVLPKDLQVTETDKVRFCYSLLGHIVYTDSIKDLTNPDFLAERAAGKVCSTSTNVSSYFKQHPTFPIHLLIGDVCLATSSINMTSFEEVGDCLTPETPIKVEGSYPLVPIMLNPLAWSPAKEPVLGVVIQLSVSLDNENAATYYPPMIKKNFGTGSSLIMVDFLSSESSDEASDYDDNAISWPSQNDGTSSYSDEGGQSKKRKLAKQRDFSRWQHQRKSLMYEAAMEVETWKEDQQQLFWKQWSTREAELQNHLASEWQARISSMEAQLQSRLDQCNTLHQNLTSALLNVGNKEKSISLREEKVRVMQEANKKLKRELRQRESASAKMDKRKKNKKMQDIEELQEKLEHEKSRRKQLQRQVRELEALNRASDDISLAARHGTEVKIQEIQSLNEEKEHLSEQLAAALRRKQYYKLQWVRLASQMHHLRTTHIQEAHDVGMDVERASPEPYFVHPQSKKELQYRDIYTMHGDGRNMTGHAEMQRPGPSSSGRTAAVLEEREIGQRERWRKGVGPGKSSQPSQILESVLKQRQELERRVRRNSVTEAGKGPTDYSTAIKEAERKLRSLDGR
nr:centrosomal protein of 120 kDa-like isoform X2 [Cherax quadricarinatus]